MIYTAVSGRAIPLGFLGENRVEAVVFDRTCWLSEYGPGTFELIHRRSQDTDPFPIAVTVSGGTVTWIPTESDTAYRGVGECQLSFYTPDGKLKKSEIYQTVTARSLTSAEDPPSPAQGWVEQVLAAAAGIQNMQAAAETLAPGSAATVTKTVDPDTGVVTLTFGVPEGLKGDTGRGIVSMSVLSTGEWRVVYTDGTSETVGYDVYSALDTLVRAAQAAAETASGAAGTAQGAATSAAGSAANAAGSAESAATSAANASHDADRAEQGAEDAQASATAAAGSATSAAGSASSAASANTAAQQAKTDAETAKTDAETAARNAEEWASQVDPDNLAHIDGYYPDMTVGNAEQLVSTLFVEDTEPYNFRKAGGSLDIGNREYDEIVGGSLPWNQLFSLDESNWSYKIRVSTSKSGNDFVITSTSSSTSLPKLIELNLVNGHKYLFTGTIIAPSVEDPSIKTASYGVYVQKNITAAGSIEREFVASGDTVSVGKVYSIQRNDAAFRLTLLNAVGLDGAMTVKNPMLIDLTLMFGSTIANYIYSLEHATAGAGVAWFRRYFPNDYYAYNPGSMESMQVSAHKTVGFNQLPASPEYISNTTVLDKTKAVRVFGGVPYEYSFVGIGSATSWRRFVKFWEMDGTMQIGGERPFSVSSGNPFWSSNNGWIDSMNNAARRTTYTFARDGWVLFQFGSGDTTPSMTVDSACFHFVHSGYRNGEYEPYVEHVYPLDDSLTLRGIPTFDGDKLKFDGDRYSADGTVKRRAVQVTLNGSESRWRESTTSGEDKDFRYFRLPVGAFGSIIDRSIISDKYSTGMNTQGNDIGINAFNSSGYNTAQIVLRPENAATITIADFKAQLAANPVTVMYLLSDEYATTETAEPFQSPQIVDDFGTEEYIDAGIAAGTRDFAFPVGHDTKYPPNLRDKLQKLPSAAADDGRYVIQQTDKDMTLVPDTSPGQIAALAVRVPDPPTTDGTYRLTVTVTDGTPAYSWVQA